MSATREKFGTFRYFKGVLTVSPHNAFLFNVAVALPPDSHSHPIRRIEFQAAIDQNDEVSGFRRRSGTISTGGGLRHFQKLRRTQSCRILRPTDDRDVETLHSMPQVIVRGCYPVLSRYL
jgi:hypothetical protein